MYTYQTEIKEFYFPSKTKIKKDGTPALVRVILRKMNLSSSAPVIEPKLYRITQVRRKGSVLYAISGLFEPKKPKWQQLVLDNRTVPMPKWGKAEKSKTSAELIGWLALRLGKQEAISAFQHLINDEPVKEAA